jgi:hypothetical protein
LGRGDEAPNDRAHNNLPAKATRLERFEKIGHEHDGPEIPQNTTNHKKADGKTQTVQRFKLAEEGLLQTREPRVSLNLEKSRFG